MHGGAIHPRVGHQFSCQDGQDYPSP
jgi:hypothetical protein